MRQPGAYRGITGLLAAGVAITVTELATTPLLGDPVSLAQEWEMYRNKSRCDDRISQALCAPDSAWQGQQASQIRIKAQCQFDRCRAGPG